MLEILKKAICCGCCGKDDSDEIVIGDKPQDGVNLASDGGAGINYGKYLQVRGKNAKNEIHYAPETFKM